MTAAFLGGCSLLRPHDDPTRFYVLTAPRTATGRLEDGELKRLRIGLKPVETPAYLRSKSMVVRSGTNEIHFAEFDRWAEPLDQGISRVMKDDLSAARNVAVVTLNSHGEDSLDYEVAIRILAFEGVRLENRKSSIRFVALWETRGVGTNATATKHGGFTANALAWDGKDYGQLAGYLSEAVAQASIALAADLPVEATPSPAATPEVVRP
jgi:uncharacterized lipoprotein YmbA